MTSLFPLPSPTLPDFKTLLVKGPYHSSAPIHLCLTHVANRPGTKALFLTPSRQKFLKVLRDFDDDWLDECGGYGAVSEILSQVNAFYPPTPLHLTLVLSMLRVSEANDDPSMNGKTVLDRPPSLLVLHELSSYLLDETVASSPTLASYLTLVAHALASASALAAQSPQCPLAFVVMDSRLDTLKLPVLKHPFPVAREPESDSSDASYRVGYLARHYFEWIGTFEIVSRMPLSESQMSSSPIGDTVPGRVFRLHETARDYDEDGDAVVRWNVREGQQRRFRDRVGSIFTYDQLPHP